MDNNRLTIPISCQEVVRSHVMRDDRE